MSTATTEQFYFAYGSNMSVERITRRIPHVEALTRAAVRGYRLAFQKVGSDGSAKCDIVPADSPSATVHGVLFRLQQRDLNELDRFEGVGHGYKRVTVTVAMPDGGTRAAETYVATQIDPHRLPYCWYREHVVRGASAAGLPADYIRMLEAVSCTADPDRARHARELAIYQP